MRTWLGWREDSIVCLHAGNMGHKQGLENLIETARLAQMTESPLEFVLMGDGNQRGVLARLADRYRLNNLHFLPLQPDDIFPSVLAAADMLVVNQRGTVTDMSLPSKLTSYFAAGRPVVAAAASNSETAREITLSRGGLVVAPDNPSALLDGLMRVACDAGLTQHLASNAQAFARESLSESAALRSYEQLVASLLAGGKHGRIHTEERQRALRVVERSSVRDEQEGHAA
jgi:glycosyltransferase involved in cell wall biosynthesis